MPSAEPMEATARETMKAAEGSLRCGRHAWARAGASQEAWA